MTLHTTILFNLLSSHFYVFTCQDIVNLILKYVSICGNRDCNNDTNQNNIIETDIRECEYCGNYFCDNKSCFNDCRGCCQSQVCINCEKQCQECLTIVCPSCFYRTMDMCYYCAMIQRQYN